jgi:hypothetical protein
MASCRHRYDADQLPIVRNNRDALYSSALFDLDAGPVTITLSDAGKRRRPNRRSPRLSTAWSR